MTYISPSFNKNSFHCPTCGVLAEQTWAHNIQGHYTAKKPSGISENGTYVFSAFSSTKCKHCNNFSIWKNEKMIFPSIGTVELANSDLPESVQTLYNEARDILIRSPRGAAALLRLSIQELCVFLGEKGKNVNEDIESLVNKGLPIAVQQALDIIRVTGNHAVHPGTINFDDQPEHAHALFGLVNFIGTHFITNPKNVAAFYNKLPEKDKQNIAKRNGASIEA